MQQGSSYRSKENQAWDGVYGRVLTDERAATLFVQLAEKDAAFRTERSALFVRTNLTVVDAQRRLRRAERFGWALGSHRGPAVVNGVQTPESRRSPLPRCLLECAATAPRSSHRGARVQARSSVASATAVSRSAASSAPRRQHGRCVRPHRAVGRRAIRPASLPQLERQDGAFGDRLDLAAPSPMRPVLRVCGVAPMPAAVEPAGKGVNGNPASWPCRCASDSTGSWH